MGTAVFDGTRITDADSLTPSTPVAGAWDDNTGGGRNVLDGDFFYQGTASVSYKVKTSEQGVNFVPDSATYDITSGPKVFLYKILCTVPGVMSTTRAAALKIQMASGATGGSGLPTNYYEWVVATKTSYPPTSSWLIVPIDGNELAWVDVIGGTISLTAVNYWGTVNTLTSALVKTENTAMDAIGYINSGTGLTLTGSSSVFDNFVSFDENTSGNRYGIVHSKEDVIYVNGFLTIGTATAVDFDDANVVLVFPAGFVGEGFFGIGFGLSNIATDILIVACAFKSLGIAKKKIFFDTALEVNATTDVVTTPNRHFDTGDYILYSKESGSHSMGLTDATKYWIRAESSTTISFHTSRSAAFGVGAGIALTVPSAPGENHSLVRDLDTRADYTVTGTTATNLDFVSCLFDGVRKFTLTSRPAITRGFLIRAGEVSGASSTSITELIVSDQTTEEGEGLFTAMSTISNITDCVITSGDDGHVFTITSTGTFTSDNIYTEFWTPASDGWKFHTQSGVDHTTDVITTNANHGFSDGDAIYYNDEGGSDTIGLTDLAKYYTGNTTSNTLTIHATKAAAIAGTSKIDLNDGSSGETHSLYSGNAVIYNNSGGLVTINLASGTTSPSFRNGSGASTVVTPPAVDATQKVTTSAGVDIENARVFLKAKDGTGPFPFEESVSITRSGSTATVDHTGHGMATSDKVVIYDADQHEYNGIRTITVTDEDTYTFTVSGTPDTPATGSPTSTFVVLSGLTDVNGEITMSRVFVSDQPITGWARLSTSSPFYKSGPINGTVDDVLGYSGTVSLVLDE